MSCPKLSTTIDTMQQDDLFVGTLTVLEQLEFYAALKMDKVDPDTRQHLVEQVMLELGLETCQNTRIGVPGRKKVHTHVSLFLLIAALHVDPGQMFVPNVMKPTMKLTSGA